MYSRTEWLFTPRRHMRLALACLLVSGLFAGCATRKVPLTEIAVPLPVVPIPGLPILGPGENDLRFVRWERAFDKLHARLKAEYPFTAWKAIDWDALYEETAPRVAAAQADKDEAAWYLALRDYIYAIPDANVGIGFEDIDGEMPTEGSLGMVLRRLDDGAVVAAELESDGPARGAGIVWGATIESWNDLPVDDALTGVSLRWAATPPTTLVDRDRMRLDELANVPPGASVRVAFRNPGAETPRVATLTAVQSFEDDDFLEGILDSPVEARVLDDGPGYLKVHFFSSSVTTPFPGRAFARAVTQLLDASIPSLIIDLRGNAGGALDVATGMAGHFVTWDDESPPVLFRHAKRGEPSKDARSIPINPAEPTVSVPGVVLIDGETSGVAEAFARFLRTQGVRIVGAESSRGSLSDGGVTITMPRGYTVFYPTRRAIDAEGKVMIEADADGEGGIAPDILVPYTMETLHESLDGDPVLRTAVQALSPAA